MAKTEQTIWSSGHTARRTQLPASKNYKKLCFVKILKQIFIARRRQRLEKVKLARLGKCRHMFVSAAMLTPICSWHRLLTILDISRVGQLAISRVAKLGSVLQAGDELTLVDTVLHFCLLKCSRLKRSHHLLLLRSFQ